MYLTTSASSGDDPTLATVSGDVVFIAALVLFAIGLVILVARYFGLRIQGFGFGGGIRSPTV